jgi:hypothetical protein
MKNKNELLVSSEIFSEDLLQTAIQAYRELAQIHVERVTDHWVLIFQDCQYDTALTKHEFFNYLINLSSVAL